MTDFEIVLFMIAATITLTAYFVLCDRVRA
jgi:hypothetical protein